MNGLLESFARWRDKPGDDGAPPTGVRRYWDILYAHLGTLAGLSLLTVALCLLLVTFPAALSGLCRVCADLARTDACVYPLRSFWKEFRQDFGKRMLLGLALAALPLGLALALQVCGPMIAAGFALLGFCLLLPMQCILYVSYAVVALPFRINVKNTLILDRTAGFSQKLPLLLLTGGPLSVFWLLSPYTLPLLLLLPGCMALAVCMRVVPVLEATVLRRECAGEKE